jgi:RNA polymerase sigma-70 factor, ECF subfamily
VPAVQKRRWERSFEQGKRLMDTDPAAHIEQRIRKRHTARDFSGAATEAIAGYGPELLGFLVALLRDEAEARELFADLCAELWSGIERFEFRSSFRSWAYAVARHLLSHRARARARQGQVRLSEVSEISKLVAKVRTETPIPFRSEIKESVERLRRQLSQEEQALLILRVDRGLSWSEVATVMLGPMRSAGEAELRRETAACRKRYERITARLRALAEAEGLLDVDG